MDQNIDIATALDIALDAENEMKFQALKNLHAKKIKSLMASVDASQKEIVKLKALNKDNMRTQMIQALRKKIRDIELVVDVLKEQFAYKTEMSSQEVTEFIMRKTLGGPKRFRPLTREELENKIAELEKKNSDFEKKLNRSHQQLHNSNSSKPVSTNKQTNGTAAAASMKGMQEDAAIVAKHAIAELELEKCQNTIAMKNSLILQYKEEISRIRARNNELLVNEEELEIAELQNDELKSELSRVKTELDESTKQLISYHEDTIQHNNEMNMEKELKYINNEDLQEQCDKLLKYNSTLLKRLAELEVELENTMAMHESEKISGYKDANSGSVSHSKYNLLETKYNRLVSKMKSMEEDLKKKSENSEHNDEQIQILKDTLREKNEKIRLLNKEIKSNDSHSNSNSIANSPTKSAPKVDEGLLNENKKLKRQLLECESQLKESEELHGALMTENEGLKQKVDDLTAELTMYGHEFDENRNDDKENQLDTEVEEHKHESSLHDDHQEADDEEELVIMDNVKSTLIDKTQLNADDDLDSDDDLMMSEDTHK